jgi:uncharacterized protein with HEPN domain
MRNELHVPKDLLDGFCRRWKITEPKTQSAVLLQLLLVGEAVKRLSEGFRAAHPEVPWRLIAGARDKMIHDY